MSDTPAPIKSLTENRLREWWECSVLGTTERRARLWEWGLHNILLGLAGVWMPFLALTFFGRWRWTESLLEGDLAMFAVTASAVSLGFFVKETQVSLRRTEMFTYTGLMLTMIAAIVTRTALAFGSTFPATSLQFSVVATVTAVLVISTIVFNFRLFTLEMSLTSQEVIREKLAEPAAQLAEQARTNTEAAGVQL